MTLLRTIKLYVMRKWPLELTCNTVFFSPALQGDDALGQAGTFWLFASVCAVGVIFVAVFVPETKGLSLEEIEKKFDG